MSCLRSFVVPALLCGLGRVLHAYPGGAPAGACGSMAPQHGANPQASASPYVVAANASTFRHGEKIKVYVTSTETYRGILLQARNPNTSAIVGSWTSPPATTKAISCDSGKANAVTHGSAVDRRAADFVYTWQAPSSGAPDVVQFQATLVKTEYVFWTSIKSPMLKLDPTVVVIDTTGTGEPLSCSVFVMVAAACLGVVWHV
ncbi:putative defense protein 3 isoform X2 [Denticeps clupeoides]|uniref:Reelin domain-containing protein n=1 Tax=Denticeps clupeoides TaxID=299321 RepID=A0AAY4ARA6_9TELE|nr:putative defense protein 3 isoform X2 [Denticeps clupeoides]